MFVMNLFFDLDCSDLFGEMRKEGDIKLDLYQIFVTHNRKWTPFEIGCFLIIFLMAVVVCGYLQRKQKIVWQQSVAGLLLLLFLGVVFASTVFTRISDGVHHYNLEPFWSWKEVYHGNREILCENLLNMVLLFPMGVLLPIMFRKRLPWWMGLLAGCAVASVIEIFQLVLCRGLFEWDDMIHNSIGCMIGCVVSGFYKSHRLKS